MLNDIKVPSTFKRDEMLYWILSGTDNNLTYVADFTYGSWLMESGADIAYALELREHHNVSIDALSDANVVDLRGLIDDNDGNNCLDITLVFEDRIHVKRAEDAFVYLVPASVAQQDIQARIDWFCDLVRVLNGFILETTGEYSTLLAVYDVRPYTDRYRLMSGQLEYRESVSQQGRTTLETPKAVLSQRVLEIVDAAIAAKDEEIDRLNEKWQYYNNLLREAEYARDEARKDRDAYRLEAGKHWNSYQRTLVEVEELTNQLAAHKQLARDVLNVVRLATELED